MLKPPILVFGCLALSGLCASSAAAQSCLHGDGPNASTLCVTLRLDNGRLAVADAELGASAMFTQRLRGSRDAATAQMRRTLDVMFQQFAPVHAFALNAIEDDNALTDAQTIELRTFTGTWQDFLPKYRAWQALDPVRKPDGPALSNFLAIAQAANFVEWGPLGYDELAAPAPLDAGAGTLRVTVADPIGDWTVAAEYNLQTGGTLPRGVDATTMAAILAPLRGELWSPPLIRERIADFLRPRGLTPQVAVSPAFQVPKVITILPVDRVARTVFVPQLLPAMDVDRLQYLLLSPDLFRTFRAKRSTALERVDLPPPALLVDVMKLDVPLGQEPVLNAETFQTQQLELAALGWTVQPLPSQARPTLTQPYADLHVTKASEAMSPDGTGAERLNFIGGGFDYHPGQSVRPVVVYERARLFGPGSLHLEVGGENTNTVGSGNLLFDFVGFSRLHRRLTLQAAYGTDFAAKRQFDTAVVDERRTAADGRAELEIVRNRGGRFISLVAEGRRSAVTLGDADSIDLTTIDVGARYIADRLTGAIPSRLTVLPQVRFGAAADATFTRYGVTADFHRLTSGIVRFNLSASAGHTTSETPQFEWLSLGGAESVRGFRRDDVLARTLLTLQPEMWVAVPGTTSAASGAALYLRQHAHIAFFTDVGAAWSTLGDLSGVKAGPGLGLRISHGPAVIKFDWARPFGSAATRAPHGRFHFNVQIKPRF